MAHERPRGRAFPSAGHPPLLNLRFCLALLGLAAAILFLCSVVRSDMAMLTRTRVVVVVEVVVVVVDRAVTILTLVQRGVLAYLQVSPTDTLRRT